MRPRLNLWLKKRGTRRTGSPRWAASGEVLYHAVFIGVGIIAAWLHVNRVLIPEWSRRDRLRDFVPAVCVIVDKAPDARASVGDSIEYEPRCWVQVHRDGAPTPPVWATAGDTTTSERRARGQLTRWVIGETVDCWFDPENPRDVVLTREGQGWPLLVLAIPVSLVVLGIVGVVRAVLRGGTSDEFRRMVARKALARDEGNPLRPSAASGLPPSDNISDSPGVKLRYRLPMEYQKGWRLAGMLFICVSWNALVGFFLYGVIQDYFRGAADWTVTLVITPLAIAGGWLAYQMFRDAQGVSGVGVTRIELSQHPLRPGSEHLGVINQAGQFTARRLTVTLLCHEIAVYRQGTDTRRSSEEVFREVLLRESSFKIQPSSPYEAEFRFTIPDDAMHSLQTSHNEIRWSIEVSGTPARWPEFQRRFRLCVYPAAWPPVAPPPLAASATTEATIV